MDQLYLHFFFLFFFARKVSNFNISSGIGRFCRVFFCELFISCCIDSFEFVGLFWRHTLFVEVILTSVFLCDNEFVYLPTRTDQ